MKVVDIPYDVLAAIFLLCLPANPFEVEQPDTAEAPMLLCQICSAWRSAAFSTPRLWIYLCYTLGNASTSTIGPIITSENHGFLRWWHARLHTIPLFLQLSCVRRFRPLRDLTPNEKEALMDLINRARYLNLDVYCSMALIELDKYESVPFNNLDTLVLTSTSPAYDGHLNVSVTQRDVQKLFPISSHTINTIRCLIMDEKRIDMDHVTKPSITWSNITSFYASIIANFPVWFLLIRQCVNIESGHIDLLLSGPAQITEDPEHKTLQHLRELVIGGRPGTIVWMLRNLSLPNLLSLQVQTRYVSVADLNQILSSTPAIQRLGLSSNRLTWDQGAFISGDISPNSVPLRNIVPKLKCIHFGDYSREDFADRNVVVQAFLRPWLGLGTHGNNITLLVFSSSSKNGVTNEQGLREFLEDLKNDVPSGVQLIVKKTKLLSYWELSDHQFAGVDPDHGLFDEDLQ